MSLYMLWPILLAVFSDVFYQVAAKSTPGEINPFASLTVTYLIGAAVSAVVFFITGKSFNLVSEWSSLNWTTFVLGIAIVGLEAGSIYMYKAGWNLNTGYIVKACILAVALIVAGYFLYKEEVGTSKIVGIIVCMVGLFLINR